MKRVIFPFAIAFLGMVLAACSSSKPEHHNHQIDSNYLDDDGNLTEPIDIATHNEEEGIKGRYKEGVVLTKHFGPIDYSSFDLNIASVEELYYGSPWHIVTLNSGTSLDAVKYLRQTNLFKAVDYDYLMETEETSTTAVVSSNPYYEDLSYLDTMCIGDAWAYSASNHLGGTNGGGSPDVVVAVIDTGVDYNHPDLASNIWTNAGEIPANGMDDDGNGYVDDVHGWDFANSDNDPIDDNGHGTHVAGIIAAENNNIGTVGVAFNCKVMPIKAGFQNGTFSNANLAQAITYAYMNGASVINMSLGGKSISLAVEEALQNAYYQCSLIAAAGNDGLCNEAACMKHSPNTLVTYPAALSYVVGVMSCDASGQSISSFSNFDHFEYNKNEYDVFACGEQIISTWPGNRYARMSGTSMATPVVAGIAALARSAYPDKEVYSNKFIHSQLSETGTKHPLPEEGGFIPKHTVCNANKVLTTVPKPNIYDLYDHYCFDNTSFSENNDGNEYINPGERIHIGLEFANRGGMASNITISADTMAHNDPTLVDPQISILTPTINIADIGTFSVGDCGKIYDGDKLIDVEHPLVIEVAPNCPNNYCATINLHLTYKNGLDSNDTTIYQTDTSVTIVVTNGYEIIGIIENDTTFTNDRRYFIADVVIIPENVTVIFEEGCNIEFYAKKEGKIASNNNTKILVYGSLYFEGTENNIIDLHNNDYFPSRVYSILPSSSTCHIEFNYCRVQNVTLSENGSNQYLFEDNVCIYNSEFSAISGKDSYGMIWTGVTNWYYWTGSIARNTIFDLGETKCGILRILDIQNCNVILPNRHSASIEIYNKFINNLVIIHEWSWNTTYGVSSIQIIPNANYPLSGQLVSQSIYEYQIQFSNNTIVLDFEPQTLEGLPGFSVSEYKWNNVRYYPAGEGNLFPYVYRENEVNMCTSNIQSNGTRYINFNDTENHNDDLIWPYIKDISIYDQLGDKVNTIDTNQFTARVTFSRAMDENSDFALYYGSTEPYADYKIRGGFVSDTIWEGTIQNKAMIENGIQRFRTSGGYAKDNPNLKIYNLGKTFSFYINTTSALSMNLNAEATRSGVELTWFQDDYDTLMGYNVYRCLDKDGNYTKINNSLIPAQENTYIDDSYEPGKEYWYTFTIVLSDFSESAPAGKVNVLTIDTINPTVYHNPVNQGYAGNNLPIYCSASDNIAVKSATLYYRTIGESNWKTIQMSKSSDRYSAVIYGSEVTMLGLEYYIAVSDGTNTITRGDQDNPYTIIVKDPSTLNMIGDVDGDGVITTKDALMIIRAINDELLLSDDQFQRADLDKSGVLNTFEALRILQYINGNVTTLEM